MNARQGGRRHAPLRIDSFQQIKESSGMKAISFALAAVLVTAALPALAAVSVKMNQIDAKGAGKAIGTIRAEDSKKGLVLHVDLKALPPGDHGFHVHELGNCDPKDKEGTMTAGLAAGGHYDPHKAGKHEGPTGQGHLGDLPPLKVDANGKVKGKVSAPRLKVADLKGRALMIHEGGDNYSDNPKPLGGGGARIACGVVK
jgi:superoxide dismutase, Cu-Zn family